MFNRVDVIDNHEVSLCLAYKWQVYSYQTRILASGVCSQNTWTRHLRKALVALPYEVYPGSQGHLVAP